MPTYIMLIQVTGEGIENVKAGPQGVTAARELFRQAGAEIKEFYLTMGRYDSVCIVEAPDTETMARAALALGSVGNMRSETLRAFTEEDFHRIIQALP
jgi:uncharacterized protein with GYD domain